MALLVLCGVVVARSGLLGLPGASSTRSTVELMRITDARISVASASEKEDKAQAMLEKAKARVLKASAASHSLNSKESELNERLKLKDTTSLRMSQKAVTDLGRASALSKESGASMVL